MFEKILKKIKELDFSEILSKFQSSIKKKNGSIAIEHNVDGGANTDVEGENGDKNRQDSDKKDGIKLSLDKRGAYNWYEETISRIVVQRNLLIVFVFISLIALCIIAFAILGITSFKTIEPFVIQISDKTGIVTLVDPVTVKQYSANKAVVEAYVVRYIRARELYDPSTYKEDYYKIAPLLSTTSVQTEFLNILRAANVASPIIAYASSRKTDLQIRSIQYFENNVMQVRFVVKVYGKDMQKAEKEKSKIVTLSYTFRDLPMKEQDRYINPLGFVITSYKVSDETL